jgi:hypothetical protein
MPSTARLARSEGKFPIPFASPLPNSPGLSQDALAMRLVVSHAEAVLSLVLCKKMFFWGIKKRAIHFLIELPVCFSFIVLNKVFIVPNNGNCWC